jgi:hypothetical protein
VPASRAWADYEPNYRAREIETLAGWITAGESGCVLGPTGSGKSNLLGFVCHQPQVLNPYLPDLGLKVALVQVDLNNLPGDDLAAFYQLILRSLYESNAQLAALEPTLAKVTESLYHKVEDKPLPFFDQFCRTAEPQVVDTLRGLRDGFKTTLSYLVGVRHELAYLRDPLEIGEVYELLDTHLCWVGAMVEADARWVINQVAETTGRSFTEAEIRRLIDLTGSYPSLLKAVSLWLVHASPVPEREAWADALLRERSLQYRLEEIWTSLTQAEQLVLCELQKWQSRVTGETVGDRGQAALDKAFRGLGERHGGVLTRLAEKGLCRQAEVGWRIRGELLAAYVATVEGRGGAAIWLDEETDTLYQGSAPLEDLSPLERAVLSFLVRQPRIRHTKTDLIVNAWPDELRQYGVADQSLYQVILELRKKIEPNWTKPCYLVTWRGKPEGGYQFYPEGSAWSSSEFR